MSAQLPAGCPVIHCLYTFCWCRCYARSCWTRRMHPAGQRRATSTSWARAQASPTRAPRTVATRTAAAYTYFSWAKFPSGPALMQCPQLMMVRACAFLWLLAFQPVSELLRPFLLHCPARPPSLPGQAVSGPKVPGRRAPARPPAGVQATIPLLLRFAFWCAACSLPAQRAAARGRRRALAARLLLYV